MQALIDVLKPMLFVSKVPMVNGTIFSVAVIFGAIVSFSAMLSSSDPSPSSTASASAADCLAVHLCFTDEEKCHLPHVGQGSVAAAKGAILCCYALYGLVMGL